MRILLAWYPIDDCGGIINHNEQLAAGFRELGHDVHTRLFLPREDVPRNGVAGGRGTFSHHTGLEFDQRRGYSWPRAACIPYRGRAITEAVKILEEFDLVIWQVAVPTKRAENRGNLDWVNLYGAKVKQIAVIHDGNFLASYPWLYVVRSKLTGLACVHHCAYNSAANINVPSALIVNPQEIGELPDISRAAFDKRQKGFLSVQTWKAWKRVPELLEALPYVVPDVAKMVAGKGIDYYYLTSKDKCKYPGVWDAAVASGMTYLDVIDNETRDKILRTVTCLVDNSWSKKYAAIGGHFNRVAIDAIKQGAIPLARPSAMGDQLFKPGVNYLPLPENCHPEKLGTVLERRCRMSYGEYLPVIENGLAILPLFDRKRIAQQFLELAHLDLDVQRGVSDPQVMADSSKAILEFFKG